MTLAPAILVAGLISAGAAAAAAAPLGPDDARHLLNRTSFESMSAGLAANRRWTSC